MFYWNDNAFLSSIRSLENALNIQNVLKYDFLNNLLQSKSTQIKAGRLVKEYYPNGNQLFTQPIVEASLLADSLSLPMIDGEKINLSQPSSIKAFPITSIEGGLEKTGGFIINDISKIATNDRSSSFHYESSHISSGKIDVFNTNFLPYSISQISTSQDCTIETSQNSGFRQIDITQIDSSRTIVPIQSSKVTNGIFNFRKIDDFSTESWSYKEIGKVSIPSSISSQQSFNVNFSSHINISLLTSIYTTAQSLWHSNTSIDLNFAITNLPTGQLAEATITGYDNLGRPNADSGIDRYLPHLFVRETMCKSTCLYRADDGGQAWMCLSNNSSSGFAHPTATALRSRSSIGE